MPAFLVQIPAEFVGRTLVNGADAFVVFAQDDIDAKAVAESRVDGDANAAWQSATVTEIVAGADLENWRFRVAVLDSSPVVDETVVGAAAATIDTLCADMVIALNATSVIAGAAYVAASNTLTVAETTDTLGDKTLLVEMLPPASFAGSVAIPGFVGAITDQGAAGAALTVAMAADAHIVPNILTANAVKVAN